MSIFKTLAFSQDYRVSQVGPLIFYRHEWAISHRHHHHHHHYVMCLKISRINIFAYSVDQSFQKRCVFNLFSRPSLSTARIRGPKLEWNQEHAQQCTGPGFIAPRRKAGSREWHSFRSSLAGVFVFSWIYSAVYHAVARTRVFSPLLSACVQDTKISSVSRT